MVAPIADVAPRIARVADLPVHAVARDAIRVVAVRCRRVEKNGYDLIEQRRVTLRQTLPILKYVAPIALIGQNRIAVLIFQLNGKAIPRSARITVAPAERQRQIFVRQTEKLTVVLASNFLMQFLERQRRRQLT